MTTDRITDAIERARRQASEAAPAPRRAVVAPRPAGTGRPRIASRGLSETEAKWDKLLKPDFL